MVTFLPVDRSLKFRRRSDRWYGRARFPTALLALRRRADESWHYLANGLRVYRSTRLGDGVDGLQGAIL